MLSCWSCSDGEEYVGNPEFFGDQQDQQKFIEQGKYSMRSTLIPIHHLLITHLHVSNFDNRKDILVIEYHVSLSPMGYMHMGSLLALNVTVHDPNNDLWFYGTKR